MKLTLTINKEEQFFIGTVKEIPAINTQGTTVKETTDNILDAMILYLEDMKDQTTDMFADSELFTLNNKTIERQIEII